MTITELAAETVLAAQHIEHEWDERALDWPLTEESIVVEVGGYKGRWALQIAQRYNPRLYVFEPQPWAYNVCRQVLAPYQAQVFPYALGDRYKIARMGEFGTDGCSFLKKDDKKTSDLAEMRDAFDVLPPHIDLMLMNIEGYEYVLLPHLLKNQILPEALMVQWHRFADEDGTKQHRIMRKLDKTYKLLWEYGPTLMAWRRI